ncbi:MAG: PHA/PHB synthase family protein [Hyphomicrobiaceae bacterium]
MDQARATNSQAAGVISGRRRKPQTKAGQPERLPVSTNARPPKKTAAAPLFPFPEDSYSVTAVPEVLDRAFHAGLARWTSGVSPAALMNAYFDWGIHLAASPGKQLQLGEKAARKWARFFAYAAHCLAARDHEDRCIDPLPQDKRFRAKEWNQWPFNFIHQSFLLQQQWWHNASTGVHGVSAQHEKVVEFAARQFLDVFSPSNFVSTNPEILNAAMQEGGANFERGLEHLIEDWTRATGGHAPPGAEEFEVGRDVAVTPGKVIYRNDLMELIQYEPATETVYPEPILIVPAWIMKYYILDLSPKNSLVRYLVKRGFTVFVVSWKNPGPEHRDFGMNDYLSLGPMTALDVIDGITHGERVHGTGYCLGGTLLSIAAAAMARDRDDRLKTLTLLAAQTDFEEPGELDLFINESQLSFLDDMMWEQGFLDSRQMAGTFQLLRSNDLIWSRMVREYLLGRRAGMNDLMAWNADATRMPYRMHSEYLRQLFLHNDLAEGRYHVGGRPVSIGDIRTAVMAVGTQRDHVAPWRSVYKIQQLTDTDVTFLLTSGGHNAGIVSEPGHAGRTYQVKAHGADQPYIDPEAWEATVPGKNGSWWPVWARWLRQRSSEKVAAQKRMPDGRALCDAPGVYVRET